mmetsp:Transcript_44108/g.116688  ORF Transcript_44108/g.116688 Transcript_44108/m.116688 type:complete len:558 (-) Transcript_44108:6-1679(-)
MVGKAKAKTKGAVAGKVQVCASRVADDIRRLQAEILEGLDAGLESSEENLEVDTRAVQLDAVGTELTEHAVLKAVGEDSLDEVYQFVHRDQQLASLTTPNVVDFAQLVNLEVLSLSHNLLTDIGALGCLGQLVDLNLNFNRVQDLRPLHACGRLAKLLVANNCIVSIHGLDVGCPQLVELSLFANDLSENSAVTSTLQGMDRLRILDLGSNPCCVSPSQKYAFLLTLTSVESFDGQVISCLDRRLARDFFESKSVTLGSARGLESPPRRPATAPVAFARPPLLPTSVLLTGQRLRSSRANRIDEVLTRSRDASPSSPSVPCDDVSELLEHGDAEDPKCALDILKSHAESLQYRLDTLQVERENLRFQIRLLEQDGRDDEPARLRAKIEALETENKNSAAVVSERDLLQTRLADLQRGLVDTTGRGETPPAESEESEECRELRWENSLLEKRLQRVLQYSEQLRSKFSSSASPSRCSSRAGLAVARNADLSEIVANNEIMLRSLSTSVQRTATGNLGQPSAPASVHASTMASRTSDKATVDVLTIGAEDGESDLEWHS